MIHKLSGDQGTLARPYQAAEWLPRRLCRKTTLPSCCALDSAVHSRFNKLQQGNISDASTERNTLCCQLSLERKMTGGPKGLGDVIVGVDLVVMACVV